MLPRASAAGSPNKRPRSRTPNLPQDKPTETAEADRVVYAERVEKAQGRRPEKSLRYRTSASTESVAAEATATPSSEAIPEGHAFDGAGDRKQARPPQRVRARLGRRNWWRISTSTSAIHRNASRRPPKSTSASRSTRLGHVLATSD